MPPLATELTTSNLKPSASEQSFSEVTLPVDPISHPGEYKVLGVRWDVPNDQLVFDLRGLAEKATGYSLQRGMS